MKHVLMNQGHLRGAINALLAAPQCESPARCHLSIRKSVPLVLITPATPPENAKRSLFPFQNLPFLSEICLHSIS
jgi:hypothetical protein